MSDKDFAPLSAACVRALNDKLYEKRKGAALEIEKYVNCNFTHLYRNELGVGGGASLCYIGQTTVNKWGPIRIPENYMVQRPL